jgi:hypothetical protein
LTDLLLVTDDAEFMCGLLVLCSHDRQTYSIFNAADLRYSKSASRARSRVVVCSHVLQAAFDDVLLFTPDRADMLFPEETEGRGPKGALIVMLSGIFDRYELVSEGSSEPRPT